MRLRTVLIATTVALLTCGGMAGIYVGILSHADMLRPQLAGDIPTQRRSVMAMDSARAALASALTAAADQQAATSVSAPTLAAAPPTMPSVVPPSPPAASRSLPDTDATASITATPTDLADVPPSVVAMAYKPRRGAKADPDRTTRGITVLHIGDSHTAADFLTGELRRQLQATYGNGGAGYVTAGKPRDVLSAALKINVSSGWTYKALQRSEDIGEFWMSGFNAVASAANETLSFTSEQALIFDIIEIEAIRRPGGGAIDIRLDGALEGSFDLNGPKVEPIVIRLVPDHGPTDRVREVSLTTRKEGVVSISSVAIYNSRAGLTYSSVGYPGATIDILNKLDGKLFAADLRRLDPQIVVLSFGTNEASKENLDIAAYTQNYEKVLSRIRDALPDAKIVLIGPPEAEEPPEKCRDYKDKERDAKARASEECKRVLAAAGAGTEDCPWPTLPKLNDVREAQRKIAQRQGLVYWNWASIMPKECGAHRWLTQSPPLMARDHVHFTSAGYRKSAAAFLTTLVPVIEKLRSRPNAVSNN